MEPKIQFQATQVNTMLSDRYEIYSIKDSVDSTHTLYHYHNCYEIHATLEGTAVFYINGQQYQLSPGTVVLIPPNVMHRIVKQHSKQYERVYVFVSSLFLHQFSTAKTNLETCFIGEKRDQGKFLKVDPAVLRAVLSFTQEKTKGQYGADIELEQNLLQYILFLNRAFLSEHQSIEEHSSSVKNNRIEEMIRYLSNHLNEHLTLEEMERQFFVSKYYIAREFKKHTGVSFHQFVLKKRLLYSKFLLKEYKSATSVFQQCGFQSYPHFLKAFKKEFGMTPKEFLRKIREEEQLHFRHFEQTNKEMTDKK